MLLAAGLSTRMRPLTDDIPKPLLPFWNHRILDLTLTYLSYYGVKSIAVNVHHGRDQFLPALKDIQNLPIRPFDEKVILGTGGGIKNMRSFVKGEHFLVTNCDFLTDVDLKSAMKFHEEKKAVATMVLIDHPDTKKYGAIGINKDGKIVEFPYGEKLENAAERGIFSGIHFFHRSIFTFMPSAKIFDINKDVYTKLISGGEKVYGYLAKNDWYDLGEIALYEKAQLELRQTPFEWMKSLR